MTTLPLAWPFLHRRDRVRRLVEGADVFDVRIQLAVGDECGDDLQHALGAVAFDHVAAQFCTAVRWR